MNFLRRKRGSERRPTLEPGRPAIHSEQSDGCGRQAENRQCFHRPHFQQQLNTEKKERNHLPPHCFDRAPVESLFALIPSFQTLPSGCR